MGTYAILNVGLLPKKNFKIASTKYFGGVSANGKLRYRRSKLITMRIARELENIVYVMENEESWMYSASIDGCMKATMPQYRGPRARFRSGTQQHSQRQ
jgi:hypothetical protein